MFISVGKIEELIQICRDVKDRMAEDSHRIHVDDIAATLQKLIDDEVAELDKMAQEYEQNLDDEQRYDDMAREYEEHQWGRLQMEEAAIEKELEVDFNWPHGV